MNDRILTGNEVRCDVCGRVVAINKENVYDNAEYDCICEDCVSIEVKDVGIPVQIEKHGRTYWDLDEFDTWLMNNPEIDSDEREVIIEAVTEFLNEQEKK